MRGPAGFTGFLHGLAGGQKVTSIYEAFVTPMAAYSGNTDVSQALIGFLALSRLLTNALFGASQSSFQQLFNGWGATVKRRGHF